MRLNEHEKMIKKQLEIWMKEGKLTRLQVDIMLEELPKIRKLVKERMQE